MADSSPVTNDVAQSLPPSEAQSPQSKPAKTDFWFTVFECVEGSPKINFDKLAEKCHYKNAETARVMYNVRRRKIVSGDAPASPSAAPPAGGTKRGRKPKDSADGEPPKRRGRKPADGPPKKRGRPAKNLVDPAPPPPPSPPSPPTKPESDDEEERETEMDDSECE